MARAALSGRLTWQLATVVGLIDETPRCRTIKFSVPDWPGHRAGQHVDVRLTAEDGYQAQRSYSIASGPEDDGLALTVERLDDGEVSPYLAGELRVGDEIELRGPIGGYFIWEESFGGPLVLIAGGSGIAPLRAMVRHWSAGSRETTASLIYSARSDVDVIYREELTEAAGRGLRVQIALTREWPADWDGHRGRVDQPLLAEAVPEPSARPLIYVCGPTPFVETIAQTLVDMGHEPARIRTERFGPTGS
jgi:ferredoxin-NADP reductase